MGALYYKKVSDQKVVRAFTDKVADLPNGVTIATTNLVQGGILAEGTPIGKGESGTFVALKTARMAEATASSAKIYNVYKGHHFKVGDVVYAVSGGAGYAITAIADHATKANVDKITLGTSLGVEVAIGDALVQASEAGASGATYKVKPVALVGEGYNVNNLGSLMVNAVTIGQIKEAVAPAVTTDIKSALPTIVYI